MAADESRDTCLLKINSKLPFVGNAMSLAKVDIGSVAYALGNPQGLNLTFSNGIISGIRRVAGRDFIQTTAPISKGSSGGALIDDKGNLLGITTFYLQGGQAMNFAIPIEAFCRP
jgi:S1-C subfamily serine protease